MVKHPIYSPDFIYSEPEQISCRGKMYWFRSVTDKHECCIWEVGQEFPCDKDGTVSYMGRFRCRQDAIDFYKKGQ
jgi:hypothetical protein